MSTKVASLLAEAQECREDQAWAFRVAREAERELGPGAAYTRELWSDYTRLIANESRILVRLREEGVEV